jgi:hypothetical protein
MPAKKRAVQPLPQTWSGHRSARHVQDILANEDQEALRWWCKRAKFSRLEPSRELARSIQKHWSGVVAFLNTRLTNGAIEAVNGLLQLAKRLARGFRSLRYFRIMAYLKAAGLHLDLPSFEALPCYPLRIANGRFFVGAGQCVGNLSAFLFAVMVIFFSFAAQ